MLQIDIVNNSGDNLELEVNGHPNNGSSTAKRKWQVHWKVQPGSGVNFIKAIRMKDIGGSTDIFSSEPPSAQHSDKKHWKAKVDSDAHPYSVYIYEIEWVKEGETTPRIYDPIIAIRPTVSSSPGFFQTTLAVIACLGLSFLLYSKLNRFAKNKKR